MGLTCDTVDCKGRALQGVKPYLFRAIEGDKTSDRVKASCVWAWSQGGSNAACQERAFSACA